MCAIVAKYIDIECNNEVPYSVGHWICMIRRAFVYLVYVFLNIVSVIVA